MIEHHLQKEMLHTLVKRESARFADLRPKTVDSNVATYHLQQLAKQGLIEKRDDGLYYLTAHGKIVGTTVTLTKNEQLQQAHNVFFIAVQNDKDQWLIRKRQAQPMYGKSGFLHGEPVAGETLETTAGKILEDKTGLTAQSFTPRGSGFITLFDVDNQPESFISFTLLMAQEVSGELLDHDGYGENSWYNGDFTEEKMIPSMPELMKLLQQKAEHFYVELKYTTKHER